MDIVLVTGRFTLADGTTPAKGTVTFALSSPLKDSAGNVIATTKEITKPLIDGALTVSLVATNSPGIDPSGVTYLVHERFVPNGHRTYSIEVPYDSEGGTLDLADVAPVEDSTITYGVTLQAFDAHTALTTGVHGIADTSALETTTGAQGRVNTHAAITQNAHGIPDAAYLNRTPALVVAASDASPADKAMADFVCDGVADEVEINAALAAGKSVRLSEGTFTRSQPIDLTQEGNRLSGSGWGTKILNPVTGQNAINVSADSCSVVDLAIDCQNLGARGASANAVSGVLFTGLRVLNAKLAGLKASGSADGIGGGKAPASDIQMLGNYVENCIDAYVVDYQCDRVLIGGNIAVDCEGGVSVDKLSATTGSSKVTISDNLITNNRDVVGGIRVSYCSDAVVTGNSVDMTSGHNGIWINNSPRALVANNAVRSPDQTANGITFEHPYSCLCIGNRVEGFSIGMRLQGNLGGTGFVDGNHIVGALTPISFLDPQYWDVRHTLGAGNETLSKSLIFQSNGDRVPVIARRMSAGHGSDLQQWQETDGTVLSRITKTGDLQIGAESVLAHLTATSDVHGLVDTANLAYRTDLARETILQAGSAVVASNVLPPGQRVPRPTTIYEVYAWCGTAPSGGPLTIAVRRNGVVVATVSIPDGEKSGKLPGITIPLMTGDLITYDITAVGSTTAGADVAIQLLGPVAADAPPAIPVLADAVGTWDMITTQDLGQTILDISGNGNHLINGGTLAVEAGDAIQTGRGYTFNGSYHHMDLTLGSPVSGAMTILIVATAFPDTVRNTYWYLRNTGGSRIQIQRQTTGKLRVYDGSDMGSPGTLPSTGYHLISVRLTPGASSTAEINTAAAGTWTASSTAYTNMNNLLIGGIGTAERLVNEVAYLSWINRRISDTELNQAYADLKVNLAMRTPAITLA